MNHLIDALLAGKDDAAPFAEIPGNPTRHYTYGDVRRVSGRFAARLIELGVTPGDRVAVQVPKSIEALMLYLAVVRAGGVFLPLNTAYTAAEVAYFVGDAEPALVVCDPKDEAAIRPIAEKVGAKLETLGVWTAPDVPAGSFLAGVSEGLGIENDVPRGPDDLAAILYTSGTTGRSKGAMLSHANLASNSETLVGHWRFTKDDVLIHALPIYHTHGLFVATNVVMIAGASMIFLPKFDAKEAVALMPRASAIMGVPTFYVRLVAEPALAEASKNMRLFVSGSAPLLAETHDQFAKITGKAILERYGMTETNMNTSNPYDGDRRAGTVGFPLPGVELRVVEPETKEVKVLPQGEIGMIQVKGPNVFQGYWRMPEKTAEELAADGWFTTGDLGKVDERGYVHIVGRGKDLIISGGFNVYPKEVESVIDELPGVDESAVIGVPHPDFGEGVVAVVVPRAGETLDAATIEAALADKLARFKQPKLIDFVDALPRNTMGKVQKNVLREKHAGAFKA
ncbi:malonyl-CoA synthase [Acuticoccus sp. I52.16.1]|uniref:malonate--CoA ligase n=1 Tax=Acuticoccus sp. I52.16.1 TaxID=2928472 RepID=UPI001FD39033|nr:malonyl-CoA synthase [Acuticoccus sp. I52.16.1]UOM36432.1 malonyl-CoA synthase [Acuticoccus sp. I52.16.1]